MIFAGVYRAALKLVKIDASKLRLLSQRVAGFAHYSRLGQVGALAFFGGESDFYAVYGTQVSTPALLGIRALLAGFDSGFW